MRNRGGDAWELRIYRGVDDSGRQRWSTKTVHGSRRHAAARLREFSDAVDEASTRAGTVGDLLERWFTAGVTALGAADRRSDAFGAPPPLAAQPRAPARGKADHRRHRRLLRLPPPARRFRWPTAVGRHGAPHPRRAPPSARPGVAVGLGLDQPGQQRQAAEVPTCRHPTAVTRAGRCAPARRRGHRPGIRNAPASRRDHGRPS